MEAVHPAATVSGSFAVPAGLASDFVLLARFGGMAEDLVQRRLRARDDGFVLSDGQSIPARLVRPIRRVRLLESVMRGAPKPAAPPDAAPLPPAGH